MAQEFETLAAAVATFIVVADQASAGETAEQSIFEAMATWGNRRRHPPHDDLLDRAIIDLTTLSAMTCSASMASEAKPAMARYWPAVP
jgi:hypothetical protein